MVRDPRSNPLALAVLVCLFERPMHPYEVAQTLRTRHKQDSIRLNYGSLYGVVKTLDRTGLIEPTGTSREGRRPKRTVYKITDAGRFEMRSWLSELLAHPVKEYLHYEAGLSLMLALPPEEAVTLLQRRCTILENRIVEFGAELDQVRQTYGLKRIHLLEADYMGALIRAEIDWTRALIDEIESGELDGLALWRSHVTDAGAVTSSPEPADGEDVPDDPRDGQDDDPEKS